MSKSKVLAVLLLICAAGLSLACVTSADEPKPDGDTAARRDDIEYVEDDTPEEPAKPPVERRNEPPPPDSIPGYLLLSNGDRLDGRIHLTRDTVLKFTQSEKENKVLHLRLAELTHIEQVAVEERMEKEWRWLENANDQKVYTGREYPMRRLDTVLHLKDGRTLRGLLTALLFVSNENGSQRFVLHKRQKGEPGTSLADLLYVKLVDFRPPEKEGKTQE